MPAPAGDEVGIGQCAQDAGVAQDVEDGIGDAFRCRLVELRVAAYLVAKIDDVAQHGEEVFLDALDHLAVDEGAGGRAGDVELDAALAVDQADVEGLVAFEQFLAVVGLVAAVQHGKRAVPQEFVQTAVAAVEKAGGFGAREYVHPAGGGDLGVDDVVSHGGCFV